MRQNQFVAQQVHTLKTTINHLKNAYNGNDIEWSDTGKDLHWFKNCAIADNFFFIILEDSDDHYESGSGSGSGIEDEDDDDSGSGKNLNLTFLISIFNIWNHFQALLHILMRSNRRSFHHIIQSIQALVTRTSTKLRGTISTSITAQIHRKIPTSPRTVERRKQLLVRRRHRVKHRGGRNDLSSLISCLWLWRGSVAPSAVPLLICCDFI